MGLGLRFGARSERGHDPALGLPVGWHGIGRQPFGRERQRLIAGDDRFDDVRRQESEIDDLHHPACREVFGLRDLVEALALFDRLVELLRLGDVADQGVIPVFGRSCSDEQLRFDTALTGLETGGDGQGVRLRRSGDMPMTVTE